MSIGSSQLQGVVQTLPFFAPAAQNQPPPRRPVTGRCGGTWASSAGATVVVLERFSTRCESSWRTTRHAPPTCLVMGPGRSDDAARVGGGRRSGGDVKTSRLFLLTWLGQMLWSPQPASGRMSAGRKNSGDGGGQIVEGLPKCVLERLLKSLYPTTTEFAAKQRWLFWRSGEVQ